MERVHISGKSSGKKERMGLRSPSKIGRARAAARFGKDPNGTETGTRTGRSAKRPYEGLGGKGQGHRVDKKSVSKEKSRRVPASRSTDNTGVAKRGSGFWRKGKICDTEQSAMATLKGASLR